MPLLLVARKGDGKRAGSARWPGSIRTVRSSGRIATNALHALAVFPDVVPTDPLVPRPGHRIDLAIRIRPGHRLGDDGGLALERMRLVGVAVVAVQGPVQRCAAGGA